MKDEFVKKVSVPSRGILFPNNVIQIKSSSNCIEVFPSPLGVSYFQILMI